MTAAAGHQLRCPDCRGVASLDVALLTHDETCPLRLAGDRVCASDAEWFRQHPLARWRWRDPDLAEHREAAVGGVEFAEGTRVLVVRLSKGQVRRTFVHRQTVILFIDDIAPAHGWAA